MEELYFALTGNEFGVHLDESTRLVSLKEALEIYGRYIDAYGCASLFKVGEGCITRIKEEAEF